MRPAAPTTVSGPRTPGDPEFDPFWARVNEAGITVVVHAGDSGYSTNGYAQDGFSADRSSGAGRASIAMLSMERAIYDFLASLVFDRLFDPLPEPADGLRRERRRVPARPVPQVPLVHRQDPGLFPEDPVETFQRHVWINPFWEDDVNEVVELMGADRVDLRLGLAAHRRHARRRSTTSSS